MLNAFEKKIGIINLNGISFVTLRIQKFKLITMLNAFEKKMVRYFFAVQYSTNSSWAFLSLIFLYISVII